MWTNGVDITGKTYRFSASVRSNSGTKYYAVGVGPSVSATQYATKSLSDFYNISGFVGTNTSVWVTPTVDYTVNPEHIKKTVGDYFTYPVFIVKGGKASDGLERTSGKVADLHTVELTADGKEREVVVNSGECAEGKTLMLEVNNCKYENVSRTVPAKTVNVYKFNAPKLSAVKNGTGYIKLVRFVKGLDSDATILAADAATGALAISVGGEYYGLLAANGSAIKLSESKTTSVAVVYDDSTGKTRYLVNGAVAYITKDGATVPVADMVLVSSEFLGSEVTEISCELFMGLISDGASLTLGDYAFSATPIKATDTATVIAFQKNTASNAIRIVAGIDNRCYDKVGFELEVVEGGASKKVETVSDAALYSSIIADGKTVSAADKGYKCFAVLSFDGFSGNIPENSYIKVRSFTDMGGVKHYDTVAVIEATSDGYEFGEIEDTARYSKKQAVLLLGQSNMAGRGVIGTVEPITDERITMLRGTSGNYTWVPMKEPLHQDKKTAGVGLAASFAKAFVETFDCELGLIPCAYGGTRFNQWQKDSADRFDDYYGGKKNYQLYANAVEMAKAAMEDSEICAILWHQGESGSGDDPEYGTKLKALLDQFMADVGLDPNKVVVIAGELGPWRASAIPFSESLHRLAEAYPNYGVVESDGLPNNPNDKSHFLAPCYRVFGYRYFDQFYNIVTGNRYTNFVDDYKHYIIGANAEQEKEDDGEITVDTTDYVANVTFDNLTVGTKYSSNTTLGNVTFATSGSAIEVFASEDSDGGKCIGVNLESGKNSPYINITSAYAAGSKIVTEAQFFLEEGFSASGPLFKLVQTSPSTSTIHLVYVGADGTLYNIVNNSKQGEALVNPENNVTSSFYGDHFSRRSGGVYGKSRICLGFLLRRRILSGRAA